ncbi:MAG: glycosyltransferase family 2 protein [Lachnospiraceae bacterium]|nr:glycosyltransferase family 2 protein [Lachnospiraceae bacterium]MBO4560074.1 glycosyltransferase family 2 protein [Lachnospiraceae bacterium]MBR5732370.1 glycosyltransferase family 2 protein [Lachnospiraceae bacterium]
MRSLMTLVVPCYNEEKALPLFMEAVAPIRKALAEGRYVTPAGETLDFEPCDTEIVFADDGSEDCTLKLLRSFHEADPGVRYVSFSRNFGKEAGIYAGLKEAKGDYVVLLDADLQHPVESIPVMYRTLTTETVAFPDENSTVRGRYDSVAMYRNKRKSDGKIRAFFSKSFFKLINRLSGLSLVDGATDFRMMTRQMVDSVLEMNEYNRFTKGIFNWVGYNTKWMPYDDAERCAGDSKWTTAGLIRYGFEGIFAFSTKPLTIAFGLGLLLCILAVIYAVYTVISTLVFGNPVDGYPSLFTMILLFGGIQLLFLGFLGQYMSRMYLETKKRPIYILKETSDEKNCSGSSI